MKTKGIAVVVCILIAATAFGQRSIGAARFIIDDRTTAVRTVTLEATSPMTSQAYTLKFPAAAPGATGGYKNILAFDNGGNSIWVSGIGVVTNATLAGDGTSANPLRINLANANSWTAHQTFSAGLTGGGSATNLNSTNTNVNGSAFTTSNATTSTFNGPVVFNNTVSQPLPQNNIFVGNASNRAAPLAPLANRILATDGTGNVHWSPTFPGSVPFTQVTSGNNTGQLLQVGLGTTIDLNGGTVESNAFLGSGSTTNAVDLATLEVNGVLSASNGGTGVTTLDLDEVLLGNGAAGVKSLNNPVGNAILTQDGAGAPEWSTVLPGGVSVPFSQISTGSNTTATMTVSPGASIIAGGGIVEATRYFGSGSVTNQVDLQTAEVAGTLTGNKGGTGLAAVDLNEVVLGNAASGIQTLDNPAGARILTHPGGAAVAPTWGTTIPSGVTMSFSQLTSGVNTGQNLQIGNGSTLSPIGTGVNTANNVVGAGPNKFSGSVAIPLNAVNQSIAFSGLVAGGSVIVTIQDPNLPGVAAWVTAQTAGVGFDVTYSAAYPTATGVIHYMVINP
jgi:hypothetical protein